MRIWDWRTSSQEDLFRMEVCLFSLAPFNSLKMPLTLCSMVEKIAFLRGNQQQAGVRSTFTNCLESPAMSGALPDQTQPLKDPKTLSCCKHVNYKEFWAISKVASNWKCPHDEVAAKHTYYVYCATRSKRKQHFKLRWRAFKTLSCTLWINCSNSLR